MKKKKINLISFCLLDCIEWPRSRQMEEASPEFRKLTRTLGTGVEAPSLNRAAAEGTVGQDPTEEAPTPQGGGGTDPHTSAGHVRVTSAWNPNRHAQRRGYFFTASLWKPISDAHVPTTTNDTGDISASAQVCQESIGLWLEGKGKGKAIRSHSDGNLKGEVCRDDFEMTLLGAL